MSLFGKDRAESPANVPVRPEPESPRRPRMDAMCTCGSSEFAPGGPVVTPWHDGERTGVEGAGSVLSCLNCGTRWYTTPKGLRTPHRDAMPPAWAMADMQREQIEKRERASEEARRERDANPRREPASKRFAMPPRPV